MDTGNDTQRGEFAARGISGQRPIGLDGENSRLHDRLGTEGRELHADQDPGNDNGVEAEATRRKPRGLLAQMRTRGWGDGRRVESMPADHASTSTNGQHLQNLDPALSMVDGMNIMNITSDEDSRKNDTVVCSNLSGRYGALRTSPATGGSDGFQQCAELTREKFQEANTDQGGGREREFLFRQVRSFNFRDKPCEGIAFEF